MTNLPKLKRLRELDKLTTKGPWASGELGSWGGEGFYVVAGPDSYASPVFLYEKRSGLEERFIADFGDAGDAALFMSESRNALPALISALELAVGALGKVADPRKRDHKEPDNYTQLGCVMHLSNEALKEIEKLMADSPQEPSKIDGNPNKGTP